MTVESGALESAYAKVEASFGTLATPASTDAIRHAGLQLTKKNNREMNPTKRGTPDYADDLPRIKTAGWSLTASMWEPSGTLGTPSYFAPLLKAAFGTQTEPTLDTTVAAAPAATATGCTLTSAGTLAVGDCLIATVGSTREVTRVKTVASAAITYDELTAAPTTPGQIVSGVNYKLATNLTESLSIFLFHTGGGYKEAVSGAIVDSLEITVPGNGEVGIAMSGPAKDRTRTGFTIPGAHTTVGNPVSSGEAGKVTIDNAVFLVLSATVRMTNSQGLRVGEVGVSTASGQFRTGRRSVTCTASFYLEDTAIIDDAEAVTADVLRLLAGSTNGNMVGLVLPKVKWEIPDTPVGETQKVIEASGVAFATDGNDQLFICEG